MGRPGNGVTPDRSTIRQSLAFSLTHRLVQRYGAGAPPVLVKGIQAAPTRRSDPPLTKLAPLSPRGRGAGTPAPCFRPVYWK
jgi:hypothetical protein